MQSDETGLPIAFKKLPGLAEAIPGQLVNSLEREVRRYRLSGSEFEHRAIGNVQRVYEAAGEEYTIIVTADHGGHDRSHGTEMPEDMTTPIFLYHPALAARELGEASILDLAPTAAAVLGVGADSEWEGRNLLS